MREYRQFICWRLNSKDKFPCNGRGELINAHEPREWLSYSDAAAIGRSIAFVFTDADPFFFIDLDDCLDDCGHANDRATEVLGMFNGAYVERSVSGKGLHIFGALDRPFDHKTRCKDHLGIEAYTSKRFVALTGDHYFEELGDDRTKHTQGFENFLNRFQLTKAILPPGLTLPPTHDDNPIRDDASVLESMLKQSAAVGLWHADEHVLANKYPAGKRPDGCMFDRSVADMALMGKLALHTDENEAQMVRLFKQSALCRVRPGHYEGKGAYRITRMIATAITGNRKKTADELFGRVEERRGGV